eukprot:CAMPEP_0181418922 /NCGR_PEP_ID=MMETSP1110-20121109/11810_1 /TAXON_ID=174948 /ORGANISM="Symbiodinium sp., Strain CCMP421" /LENGTH=268 /DNA_ID=CAMNT_0023541927 /DNA_START=73 /DNA_END=880 /DNA_ORIENTATION=+
MKEDTGVVAAFAFMVACNVMATKKVFGGKDNKEVSDENPTYLTPDGKTFAVWGIIYLLETMLVFAQWSTTESTEAVMAQTCPLTGLNVRERLILAFIANGIWLPIFLNELFWTSLGIMAAYFAFLVSIYTDVNMASTEGVFQHICLASGIAMNASWIVVALSVNTFVALGKLGWKDQHGVAGSTDLAAIMIAVVAAVACWRSVAICDLAWAFVAAWALKGISRMQSQPDAVRFPLDAMDKFLARVSEQRAVAASMLIAVGLVAYDRSK